MQRGKKQGEYLIIKAKNQSQEEFGQIQETEGKVFNKIIKSYISEKNKLQQTYKKSQGQLKNEKSIELLKESYHELLQ